MRSLVPTNQPVTLVRGGMRGGMRAWWDDLRRWCLVARARLSSAGVCICVARERVYKSEYERSPRPSNVNPQGHPKGLSFCLSICMAHLVGRVAKERTQWPPAVCRVEHQELLCWNHSLSVDRSMVEGLGGWVGGWAGGRDC